MCVSIAIHSVALFNDPAVVHSGTSLLRVVYRDSESGRLNPSVENMLMDTSIRRLFLSRLVW